MPPLAETFRKGDDRPFGGSVAYKLVEQLYPDVATYVKKESVEETWKGIYDTSALYLNISQNLFTSDEGVIAIMDYAKAGNDIILCAAGFDYNFTNRLGCSVSNDRDFQNTFLDVMEKTSVNLLPSYVNSNEKFEYYYRPFSRYFNKLPKDNFRILGLNSAGQVNSFVYFHGKGRIFMHCDPRAFSNYFLLQKENYKYFSNLLSLVRKEPQHVYWNDYYVSKNRPSRSSDSSDSPSSLSEIMNHPALSAAFWLILLLLLLFILYGMKRKQRIIEKVKPNENTSVNFTETVGRLYLQKKDNKNIAEKMVTYFNEFIRNQYFLNTSHVNDDFITTLGRKSGIPKEQVESLYRAIEHTQAAADIDDYQLLSLNQQIQKFYKNKT